ncbi:MAG: prepilin-type N-terminal cleavage/methylation domain-containing protein [Pannonibacter indicus]
MISVEANIFRGRGAFRGSNGSLLPKVRSLDDRTNVEIYESPALNKEPALLLSPLFCRGGVILDACLANARRLALSNRELYCLNRNQDVMGSGGVRHNRAMEAFAQSKGFSMIEVLVALLVFSIILVGAIDSLRLMRRVVERAEAALVQSVAQSRDIQLLEMIRYASADSVTVQMQSNGLVEVSARTFCRAERVMPVECTLIMVDDQGRLSYTANGKHNTTEAVALGIPQADGEGHPCRPLSRCISLRE